jgi:hypothetical protein
MMGSSRRHRLLLDDLKAIRRYRKLNEEAPDRSWWRTGFLKGCGTVIRQAM